MKATLIVSFFLVAGSWLYHHYPTSGITNTMVSYKVSKARKTKEKPIPPFRIIVDKSDYELSVYDAKGWYATYPVVFGSRSLDDKKMEGDRKTPEGNFKIASKRVHEKWCRMMLLDYPNAEALAKFYERKRRGEIPPGARPGGGVGIHGTWPRDDYMVDRYSNWTNGCISLKNEDVVDLYSYITVGTPVMVKR